MKQIENLELGKAAAAAREKLVRAIDTLAAS
jgi:hypothetical protein